jgi:uncharacterized protein (DUF2252 family)
MSEEIKTPEQRAATGKAARSRTPRSSHAAWEPPSDRPSPTETLGGQDATRVKELVPVRYGRMLASPFTFYRGAAAIMARDLDATPRSGLDVQLCGDAHLSNFGVFSAPSRELVFDINDFDETHPGPFEWDLKRLAASLEIAGRDRGFKGKERRAVTLASAQEYCDTMARFASMRDLDVWHSRLDISGLLERLSANLPKDRIRQFEKNVDKARNKDSLRALAKLTELDEQGNPRIASRPPLLVPIKELAAEQKVDEHQLEATLKTVLASYRKSLVPEIRRLSSGYHYVDAAHKVVGVGSVGNRAWVALLLGRDADDPLFLQFKEAQASVLEPFTSKSRYSQHGRRVVEGQRLMQAAGDSLLGWLTAQAPDGHQRDFYVRQLWDGKGSAQVELMGPREMTSYARMCGWTLARAHARSGDRIALAGYLGSGKTFSQAIAEFANAYADQNESDYAVLMKAVDAGELAVQTGL